MDMQVPESLEAAQIKLEEDALGLGRDRYRAKAEEDQSATPPGRRLLRDAVNLMGPALVERIESLLRGRANQSVWIAYFLQQFDTDEKNRKSKGSGTDLVAHVTSTACLKEMYTSERAVQTVAIELAKVLESTINYAELKKANPQLYERLLRRTARAHNQGSSRALLRGFQEQALVQPRTWTEGELAELGLWLMTVFCKSTQMATMKTELVRPKKGKPRSKKVIKPTDAVKKLLDEEHTKAALLRPLMFPMICPPLDWTTPLNGGYLKDELRKVAVKRARLEYLKDMHEMKTGKIYAAMNALQKTPWVVNADVHGVLAESWNTGAKIAGLPKKEEEKIPPKVKDPEANPEAHAARQAAAKAAYDENEETHNARRDVEGNLQAVSMLPAAGRFYFVYTMDRRGRLYASSDYLSPQGTDVARGLLRFADGVPLGEHGARWLAIHGANCYGEVDKESFDTREKWVRDNKKKIIDSANDPLVNTWWADTEKVDKPWQFLAFCKEWAKLDAWRTAGGRDEDFISHLPVSVDGTCNGLQHLSMLMRDKKGGEATNLIPSEKPQDIYQRVADEANRLQGVAGKGNRKLAKKPTMTATYGSTWIGTRKQLEEAIRAMTDWDEEQEKPYEVAKRLTPVMRDAIKNECSRAVAAMKWLQDVARLFAQHGCQLWWTTPSGLIVEHCYLNVVGKKLDKVIDGKRQQFTLTFESTKLNKRKQVSAIVANYVHSLDAAHLVRTVNYAVTKGVEAFSMVHDSYGTHAGSMRVLDRELHQAFVDQYSRHDAPSLGRFLEQMLWELAGDCPRSPMPDVPKTGDLEPAVVMESKYFFS